MRCLTKFWSIFTGRALAEEVLIQDAVLVVGLPLRVSDALANFSRFPWLCSLVYCFANMPQSANQNALRTNGWSVCIVHIRVHPFWVINNLNITDHSATDIALRTKGSRPTALFKSSNFTHLFLSPTDLQKDSDTLFERTRTPWEFKNGLPTVFCPPCFLALSFCAWALSWRQQQRMLHLKPKGTYALHQMIQCAPIQGLNRALGTILSICASRPTFPPFTRVP